MKTFELTIVTPEGCAFKGQVEYTTLPGAEGELGVYPGHEFLVTTVQAGEIHLRVSGKDEYLAIGEGFAEIGGEKVEILTECALKESDIDEGKAEAAIARAKAAMEERVSDEEIAAAKAMLSRSTVQLNLKRKRRGSS